MSDWGFEILDWDSSFFGLKVARATSSRFKPGDQSIVCKAKDAGIRCLYFLIDSDCSDSLSAMRDFGCKYVDGRLTLERHQPVEESESAGRTLVRAAEESDLASVIEIASSTQWDTRFFKDSRFSRRKCRDLYVEWISKDLRSGNVLVAVETNDTGRPLGFLSYCMDCNSDRAEISLIAVGEDSRGKGLADSMMVSALTLFKEHGIGSAEVVTQASNIAAQRLYQKHGFLSRSLKLWFHLWLD